MFGFHKENHRKKLNAEDSPNDHLLMRIAHHVKYSKTKLVLDGQRCRDVRGKIHTKNGPTSRAFDEDRRSTLLSTRFFKNFFSLLFTITHSVLFSKCSDV